MVDVGAKDISQRTALAVGVVSMQAETLAAINDHQLAKGEVLAVARVAGIRGGETMRRSDTALSSIGAEQSTG